MRGQLKKNREKAQERKKESTRKKIASKLCGLVKFVYEQVF